MYCKIIPSFLIVGFLITTSTVCQAKPESRPPAGDAEVHWQEQTALYAEQTDELTRKHREETAKRQAYWEAHKNKSAQKNQ